MPLAILFYRVTQKKNGNFWKPNKTKTFLWRKHAVDRSTVPWLLNGEVVCSSRSLFRSAANCTWLPLRISKVPVFLCHPVLLIDSPCFGHYYVHYQELATMLFIYHIGCFVLVSLCVGYLVLLGLSSIRFAGWSTTCDSACNTDTTQTQPHLNSNTQQTKNETADVVNQQHSRKLLMMGILMSETCWVYKK